MAHGGADGGRSHGGVMAADSRGPTNSGGAGGGGARGGEPTSQGDAEDPGGQGGAEGSGDQGEGRAPEIRGGATEDPGGAEGRKEPNGAGGMERQGAARGEESWGDGGSTPDQGGAGGTREPGGAGGSMGDGGGEGARSRGGATGSTDRDWVYRPRRSPGLRGWRRRWGKLQSRRHWRMAVPWGSHRIDGGLRASRGAARRQRWRRQERVGIFEERALEKLKPPQGWTRESRTKEGWTEPAGTMERGEGAVRSPEQHPSLSDPAPCLAVPDVLTAHPQPRCRGRSSTPRSHRPRLAPSWWALSPALAPGLMGWAQLPGRSSAQSLGLALARRSRQEMALRHRWARAGAPYRGEMVGWALGLEWIWRDHPQGRQWGAIHFSPESTPQRRRNPLEDHLRTTALCLRCPGLHRRMSRARRPGSWWC